MNRIQIFSEVENDPRENPLVFQPKNERWLRVQCVRVHFSYCATTQKRYEMAQIVWKGHESFERVGKWGNRFSVIAIGNANRGKLQVHVEKLHFPERMLFRVRALSLSFFSYFLSWLKWGEKCRVGSNGLSYSNHLCELFSIFFYTNLPK